MKSQYVVNMPSIMKEPWAKLMILITPKIKVRPMAVRLYTPPIRIPLTMD
jgi:hypothetical protein